MAVCSSPARTWTQHSIQGFFPTIRLEGKQLHLLEVKKLRGMGPVRSTSTLFSELRVNRTCTKKTCSWTAEVIIGNRVSTTWCTAIFPYDPTLMPPCTLNFLPPKVDRSASGPIFVDGSCFWEKWKPFRSAASSVYSPVDNIWIRYSVSCKVPFFG